MTKNGKTPERPKLTTSDKRMMLQCFARLPEAFEQALPHLKTEDFSKSDAELAVLWDAVTSHHQAHLELPDEVLLIARVRDTGEKLIDAGDDFDLDHAERIVKGCFRWDLTPEKRVSYTRWSLRTLQQFVEERIAGDHASIAVNRNMIPSDYSAYLLDQMQTLDRLKTVSDGMPDDDLFPTDWAPRGIELTPTGTFLDPFLGGGSAPGEIYGLVAGFGVGKTTLAVQLAIAGAKYECIRRRRPNWDGKRRLYFMFYWEIGHPDEMRIRALSCAANVSKTALEQMRGWTDLSTSKKPKTLKPYERSVLDNELTFYGEQERCRMWMPLINQNTAFYDMTGQDPRHPGRGTGGIAEIRSLITRKLESMPDAVVGGISIDFLGAMLDRQLTAEKRDLATQLRHTARTTILQAKNELAGRFACPVYLFHQLKAEFNGRAPGAIATSADAQEIRAFAQHCDFSFAIGLPNTDSLAVVNCDKHRRQPAKPKQIIRIEGDMGRIESCNGEMVLDPVTQRIITNSERDTVAPPVGHARANGNGNGRQAASYSPRQDF